MTTTEKQKTKLTLPNETEIRIERTFNAPRNLVWQLWTDCAHLSHWWGPKGWALPVCQMDFRVGGSWFYCMQGTMPDSPEVISSYAKAEFLEIDAPALIVYNDAFADADGNIDDAMPLAHITIQFEEEDGKTLVTSTTRYASKDMRDQVIEMGVEEGIGQTYDRLDEYLITLG